MAQDHRCRLFTNIARNVEIKITSEPHIYSFLSHRGKKDLYGRDSSLFLPSFVVSMNIVVVETLGMVA